MNFEGLNTISTIFSVIFCVFNTLLGNLIVLDYCQKTMATILVYMLVFVVIFATTFKFENM